MIIIVILIYTKHRYYFQFSLNNIATALSAGTSVVAISILSPFVQQHLPALASFYGVMHDRSLAGRNDHPLITRARTISIVCIIVLITITITYY